MNSEKQHEFLLSRLAEQSDFLLKETIEVDKLKLTWIANLITVVSTLLGGFSLLKDYRSITTTCGFVILFATIIAGLSLILQNLNAQRNGFIKAIKGIYFINPRILRIIELNFKVEKSQNLTTEEEEEKVRLEKEIADRLNVDKITLDLFESIPKKRIAIANYLLIGGFFIGGLLLTIPKEIERLFY